MDLVQWCAICNSRPGDGTLKIENPFDKDGPPVDLEACVQCVEKLHWEAGIVKKENDHA